MPNATTRKAVSVLVGAILAVSVVMAFLADFPGRWVAFSADGLYLPVLFRDVLGQQGNWSDWYLTPAPYLFPDYLLFLVAYFLGQDAYQQIIVYAVLQLALTLVVVRYLAKQAGVAGAYWTAAAAVGVIAYLAIDHNEPYVFALFSAFHYSVFLASVWFAALLLSPDASGRLASGKAWAMACVAVFLLVLSDALAMVQVVLPLAAWVLLRAWRRGITASSAWRWAVSLVVSGGAAMAAYPVLIPHATRDPSHLAFGQLLPRLAQVGQQLLGGFSDAPLLVVGLVAVHVVAAGCLLRMMFVRDGHVRRPLQDLCALMLIAAVGNLLAAVLVSNIVITSRYFIPSAYWPVVLGVLALASRRFVEQRQIRLAFAGVACAAIAAGAAVSRHGIQTRYVPIDLNMACIDNALEKSGAKRGVSQYWDAKRLEAFSQHDLQIAVLSNTGTSEQGQLSPWRWIISDERFAGTYDFAITNNDPSVALIYQITDKVVEEAAGPPSQRVTCGSRNVLIYGSGMLRLSSN